VFDIRDEPQKSFDPALVRPSGKETTPYARGDAAHKKTLRFGEPNTDKQVRTGAIQGESLGVV
jgi:hypothetical protein